MATEDVNETMLKVSAYKRPASLEEALVALGHDHSVLVGGGTRLRPAPGAEPVVVVDLQDAGLAGVERIDGDHVALGAMATLEDLAESSELPADRPRCRPSRTTEQPAHPLDSGRMRGERGV